MCIMEVRAGQHASTIAQAMAHNASTLDRDLDMFKALLNARDDVETLNMVIAAQRLIHRAYGTLLDIFEEEIHAHEHEANLDHEHEPVGNERSLVEQAHHDAELARRFETR
jgi:hypothetical protein